MILDPAGHKTSVPTKLKQIEKNVWRCEYMSNLTGLHSVNVFYAGKPIPNSPFGVRIAPGIFFEIKSFQFNYLLIFLLQFPIHVKFVLVVVVFSHKVFASMITVTLKYTLKALAKVFQRFWL